MCSFCLLSFLFVAPVGASRPSASVLTAADDAYEAFQRRHGVRDFTQDGMGYQARLELFQQRLAQVEAQNARPGSSWKAGLNRFADWTEAEFGALLNYRRTDRSLQKAEPSSPSFMELQPKRHVEIAESMDWRSRLHISKDFLRNQGQCGSCWAVTSTEVLEMHLEINTGSTHRLSFEQLVDCTPNPKHCGGDGGCKGATAEFAFQYVQEHGLDPQDHYQGYLKFEDESGDPSTDYKGTCKPPSPTHRILTDGYVKLPENQYQPLLQAVATQGPVAVSVAAKTLKIYESGVFDDCTENAVIDHAVTLIGYGLDEASGKKYWLIRNSWGPSWGEQGHIRMSRDHDEAGYCGTDNKPQEGTGCDGGPSEVEVCGMCGILYDTAYPKSVRMATESAVPAPERNAATTGVIVHNKTTIAISSAAGSKVIVHNKTTIAISSAAGSKAIVHNETTVVLSTG